MNNILTGLTNTDNFPRNKNSKEEVYTMEQIIYNLRTIGRLTKNKKLNTTQEFLSIESDSYMQPLSRYWNGDNRSRTVFRVCEEINTALLVAKYIVVAADIADNRAEIMEDIKTLHKVLSRSTKGIISLCETYENDTNVVAHLLPLIKLINESCAALEIALSKSVV